MYTKFTVKLKLGDFFHWFIHVVISVMVLPSFSKLVIDEIFCNAHNFMYKITLFFVFLLELFFAECDLCFF